ncbi:lasso peptide biosynthesis B2 protein [Novosphingobium sp. BL-52-GroH]|uniref:lasso peptide biosynthesis B2 protein n=1 Tax=Novosphingobium sp. BL-52-GroH TaxID=3349877 RepID=UPI00384C7504
MLQPWISHCTIGDHTILLDAKRNRYSALSTVTMNALVAGRFDEINPAILKTAKRKGWILPGSADPAQPAQTTLRAPIGPTRQLAISGTEAYVSWPLRVKVARALVSTRLTLAIYGLERSFDMIGIRNAQASRQHSPQSPQEILGGFNWAERYILGPNVCLIRSIAMQTVLARAGLPSQLLFGVKLYPFEAHCWLQQGDMLINDTLERTGMFTPIRMVS